MLPRSRPLLARPARLGLGLCLAAACLAIAPLGRSASVDKDAAASETISDFTHQPTAAASEAWLAQNIPSGTSLADRPYFFAAAAEAYYDAEGEVLVFVFRSVAPGRWVAWVSIDPERNGVIATDASDL